MKGIQNTFSPFLSRNNFGGTSESTMDVQKVSVLNFCRLHKFLFEQKNYLVTLVHM